MTGSFNINVTAVSAGHLLHDFNHIIFQRIEDQIRTKLLRQLQPFRFDIQHHKFFRITQSRGSDHSETKRTRAGQHDEIVPADLRSFNAPGRASVRLNQYSFFDRQILRYVVVNPFFGIPHILGKTAVYVVLKSINIVFLTHPVFAPLTESTLPTGNDLFRDKAVANLHVSSLGHILPQLNHVTEKLVARNHWRFDIRRLTVAAPERLCAHIRFNITSADAAGLNFDNNIIGTGTRYRYFFHPIIAGRVSYYCPHGFREIFF